MGVIAQALVKELNLTPENDISNAASTFTDVVKGYIRTIQDDPSMETIEKEEEILKTIYKEFFDYSVKWAASERKKYMKVKNHPEADKLKKQASDALNDLQKNIVRFALCYMHIDRCAAVVHEEIKKNEHNFTGDNKKFKWTSDTGLLLRRYQKERTDLREANERLAKALASLEKTEEHIQTLRQSAEKTLGKQDADKAMSSLRSNLRTGNFDKARKVLAETATAKKKFVLDKKGEQKILDQIKKSGEAYVAAIEEFQDDLKMEDGKLYLGASEISVVVAAQEREIEQKSKYIAKYHQPYMDNKLKSLGHLRDKLLIFGSLEGLTTLYMRLMRGMAEPMVDVKDVRSYESEVIENVNYILGGQFQEIANIEKWTHETMNEFYECMAGFDQAA